MTVIAINPKQHNHNSIQSTGSKKSKTIDITSFDNVPETSPEEMKFYPKEKWWEISKRLYFK